MGQRLLLLLLLLLLKTSACFQEGGAEGDESKGEADRETDEQLFPMYMTHIICI